MYFSVYLVSTLEDGDTASSRNVGLWSPIGRSVLSQKIEILCLCDLTFKSLAVSLRTTRFNIQNFYMVLALR
jgi:hypothetical protein